jgi:hypothetical protein
MAVHSERLEAAEQMVNYVNREKGIERPDMDTVSIDLRIEDEVIPGRLLLPPANLASLALILSQPTQR